jgi:phosphatidate phosphatase APP1
MATDQINGASSPRVIKKWSQWLLRRLRINTRPVVKVYHGFGDADGILVFGHVLRMSPFPQKHFSSIVLRNTVSLLRLFIVKPFPRAKVRINWHGDIYETTADADGFFRFEWDPKGDELEDGWLDVVVELVHSRYKNVTGKGKIMVPATNNLAFVSDIDDTFLISHSSDLQRRLYVLLTKNARTRKPFESVVQHYQLLANGGSEGGIPRPFFYVSSSEWNLYDYIRAFSDRYHMPGGVYLLSQIKRLHEFWMTGQNKHRGKFDRIVRIMEAYPNRQFVLLGDDSQEDPYIYQSLARAFPYRVVCVYLRHVRKEHLEKVRKVAAEMQAEGTEVCYFTHSRTAIAHSRKIGLIEPGTTEDTPLSPA